MEKTRKILFVVNAVRWFDRINGNTYHSVNVTRCHDGKTIYHPITYGYGDSYRQTALEIMDKEGFLPVEYTGKNDNKHNKHYLYERENNYPIMWNVSDGLKRDCIENGKA